MAGDWKATGLDENVINEWKAAGVSSPVKALGYMGLGIDVSHAVIAEKYCDGSVSQTLGILATRADQMVGHCFYGQVAVVQAVDSHHGIARLVVNDIEKMRSVIEAGGEGGQLKNDVVWVDFENNPVPVENVPTSLILRGVGSFKYTTTDRSIKIIPSFIDISGKTKVGEQKGPRPNQTNQRRPPVRL